jgi:hypothetical protein
MAARIAEESEATRPIQKIELPVEVRDAVNNRKRDNSLRRWERNNKPSCGASSRFRA